MKHVLFSETVYLIFDFYVTLLMAFWVVFVAVVIVVVWFGVKSNSRCHLGVLSRLLILHIVKPPHKPYPKYVLFLC